ncbi:putative target of rapamycin (TOR) [Besnoitia besnoiti]|uniref:Putative target of rapamycin (TOR) n=1 Tax=Besnoitia besnoiti TaxID=94643 RepID=A0A2A9MDC9_BESBE|nr:putative target of rapamycin (TOR) [Besnoitia besnoiti]PFH33617.1 putative target of rapamycin (TOR) [Besnoitia besnoiti]
MGWRSAPRGRECVGQTEERSGESGRRSVWWEDSSAGALDPAFPFHGRDRLPAGRPIATGAPPALPGASSTLRSGLAGGEIRYSFWPYAEDRDVRTHGGVRGHTPMVPYPQDPRSSGPGGVGIAVSSVAPEGFARGSSGMGPSLSPSSSPTFPRGGRLEGVSGQSRRGRVAEDEEPRDRAPHDGLYFPGDTFHGEGPLPLQWGRSPPIGRARRDGSLGDAKAPPAFGWKRALSRRTRHKPRGTTWGEDEAAEGAEVGGEGESASVVPAEYVRGLYSSSERRREDAVQQIRIHLEVMVREGKGGVGRIVEEVCAWLWNLISSRQLAMQLGALQLMCALLVGPFLYWENEKLQLPFLHLACEALRSAARPPVGEADSDYAQTWLTSAFERRRRKLEPLITEGQGLLACKVAEAISAIAVSGNNTTSPKTLRDLLRVCCIGWLRRGQPALHQLTAVRVVGRLARSRPEAVPADVRRALLESHLWAAIHHPYQPRLRKAGVITLRALLTGRSASQEKRREGSRRRTLHGLPSGFFDNRAARVSLESRDGFLASASGYRESGPHKDALRGLDHFWKHLLKGLAAGHGAAYARGVQKQSMQGRHSQMEGTGAHGGDEPGGASAAGPREGQPTRTEETTPGSGMRKINEPHLQGKNRCKSGTPAACSCGSTSWLAYHVGGRKKDCGSTGALVSSCAVCKAAALQEGSLLALAEVFEASRENEDILVQVRQQSPRIIPLLQELFASFSTLAHPTRVALSRVPALLASLRDEWFFEQGGLEASIACVSSLLRDHPRVFMPEPDTWCSPSSPETASPKPTLSRRDLTDLPESVPVRAALSQRDPSSVRTAGGKQGPSGIPPDARPRECGLRRHSLVTTEQSPDSYFPAEASAARQQLGEATGVGQEARARRAAFLASSPASRDMRCRQRSQTWDVDNFLSGSRLSKERLHAGRHQHWKNSALCSRPLPKGLGTANKELPLSAFHPSEAPLFAYSMSKEGGRQSKNRRVWTRYGIAGLSSWSSSASGTAKAIGAERTSFQNGVAAIKCQAAEACAAFNCLADLALLLPETMETFVDQFIPDFLRAIELTLIGAPSASTEDTADAAGGMCFERESFEQTPRDEISRAVQEEYGGVHVRIRVQHSQERGSQEMEEAVEGSTLHRRELTSAEVPCGVSQSPTAIDSNRETPQCISLASDSSTEGVRPAHRIVFSSLEDQLCHDCQQQHREGVEATEKLVQHAALQCVSKLIRAFGGHMKGRLDFLLQSMFSGGINRNLLEALRHLVDCPHIRRAVQDLFLHRIQEDLVASRGTPSHQKAPPSSSTGPRAQGVHPSENSYLRRDTWEARLGDGEGGLRPTMARTAEESRTSQTVIQDRDFTRQQTRPSTCIRCGRRVTATPPSEGEETRGLDKTNNDSTSAIETMLLAMQGAFWFGIDDFQTRLLVAECMLQLARHPQAHVRAAAVMTICRLVLSPASVLDHRSADSVEDFYSSTQEFYPGEAVRIDEGRRYSGFYNGQQAFPQKRMRRTPGELQDLGTRKKMNHHTKAFPVRAQVGYIQGLSSAPLGERKAPRLVTLLTTRTASADVTVCMYQTAPLGRRLIRGMHMLREGKQAHCPRVRVEPDPVGRAIRTCLAATLGLRPLWKRPESCFAALATLGRGLGRKSGMRT